MSHGSCPGVPEECDHSRQVMQRALDGLLSAHRLGELRTELSHCAPCLQIFDLEMRFRLAMSHSCREAAPPELRVRITKAITRIDLSHIDIEDL